MNNPIPEPNYVPVDCDMHSRYELACLRRKPVHLTWIAENVVYDQSVIPLDVRTESHAEYLIVRLASAEERRIRLDHIRRMTPT